MFESMLKIVSNGIELHGDQTESKKETVEKKTLKLKKLILKPFKQIEMNWNLCIGSFKSSEKEMETYHYQVISYNRKKKKYIGKKNPQLCKRTVSQAKSITIQQKPLMYSEENFCAFSQLRISSIGPLKK